MHLRSYPAVFTALSMSAHRVSLQRACGGVAAGIHTFLGEETKAVRNMRT